MLCRPISKLPKAAFLGQFAGDALENLVEFQSPADIRRSYPDGIRELADGGTWNTRPADRWNRETKRHLDYYSLDMIKPVSGGRSSLSGPACTKIGGQTND